VGKRDDDNLLFEVWLLSRVTTRAIDEAIRDSGLTADEFAVYSVLTRHPCTPSELAGWLAAPPTTVSSYVKRFERRGHVRREPSAADGRSYQVALTQAGQDAHSRAGVAFLTLLDRVRSDLGPAEEHVHRAMSELRTALSARSGVTGPAGDGSQSATESSTGQPWPR